MERSREYLIDAIRRRDPDVLRDIVDTLDARLSVAPSKKAVSAPTVTIRSVLDSVSVTWDTLTGKPTTFPPSEHTHSQYLEEETDPTVPAHVKDITQDDIDLWNSSSEIRVGVAFSDVSVDSLVGIVTGGIVRADADLGIQAIGVALNSALTGEDVQYSFTGEIFGLTVPFTEGEDLYLGTNGNLSLTPPVSGGISQRVGTATPTGAIISLHQPIYQG